MRMNRMANPQAAQARTGSRAIQCLPTGPEAAGFLVGRGVVRYRQLLHGVAKQ